MPNSVPGEQKGLVFNIQRYSIKDGPGIRTTVFMKGCPLRCLWCSNPESQNTYPEIITRDIKCVRCGKCEQICPEKFQPTAQLKRTEETNPELSNNEKSLLILDEIHKWFKRENLFLPLEHLGIFKELIDKYNLHYASQGGYPEEFVEWMIHNTCEATTYSSMLYLKFQTLKEREEKNMAIYDLSKDWHLTDVYNYWLTNIKDK